MSDLYSSSPGQVFVEMELLFQLQRLVPRVRLSRPFRFLAAVCVRTAAESYKMNDRRTRCFPSSPETRNPEHTQNTKDRRNSTRRQTIQNQGRSKEFKKHAGTYFRRIYSVPSSTGIFEADCSSCSCYCHRSHCLRAEHLVSWLRN